jgi:hypothetical protein
MRIVSALLLMAIWTAALIYLLWGLHYSDLEKRVENIRQLRSGWPSVPGSIVDVKFHDADPTYENDQSYAAITYQYSVSKVYYNACQNLNYYSHAQKQAIRYSPGKSVTVHFDPDNAAIGLIEPMNISVLDVSKWWEVLLRMLIYPSIIIGCIMIWGMIAVNEKPKTSPDGSFKTTRQYDKPV